MSFVYDDVVIIVKPLLTEFVQITIKRCHRNKKMVQRVFRAIGSYPQFTEIGVSKYTAESMQ